MSHKILVVDDSRVIRMRVKEMLPKGNFEIIEAQNGQEAFHLISSEHPNLIMLDFLLPKMSGWEVYQEIQKHPNLKSIPLVMMSGRKEEVTDKLPEPFELFSFIEKPFDQKQLIDAIKESIAKARKLAQPSTGHSQTRLASESSRDLVINLQNQVHALQGEVEFLKSQVAELTRLVRHERP